MRLILAGMLTVTLAVLAAAYRRKPRRADRQPPEGDDGVLPVDPWTWRVEVSPSPYDSDSTGWYRSLEENGWTLS